MSNHDDSHRDHSHENDQPHGHDHPHKVNAQEQDGHEHGAHGHDHGGAHGHTHGTIDPSIIATQRGLWAIKWSFVVVVLTILGSAIVAGYESIQRFFYPHTVGYLWAVAAASIIGFLGNEGVAIFRIKVGKEMGSAALIADGYHARTDGIASLAVLLSVIGVWMGYRLADPIIGILMTLLILRIVWESAAAVFTRLLDGVDPDVADEIKAEARRSKGVEDVSEVRVRWLGHRMHAELNVAVGQELSVEKGHNIANQVRHDLLHKLKFLSGVTIHVDPANASGEIHHHIEEHAHGGEPVHSH